MAMIENAGATTSTLSENDTAATKNRPRQKLPWERIDLSIEIVNAKTSDGRALRVPNKAKPLFCLEIPYGALLVPK